MLSIFSEPRGRKCLLAVTLVAATCFYSYFASPLPSLRDCLSVPQSCDGKVLSTNAGGKVEGVEAWGFWVRNGDQRVRVMGRAPDVRVGDTVFLEAVFHQEGYLELQQIYVSKYRDVRIWISLPAVAWVIWVFWRTYRFDLTRRVLVPRSQSGGNGA